LKDESHIEIGTESTLRFETMLFTCYSIFVWVNHTTNASWNQQVNRTMMKVFLRWRV